jgi:hypothetical protein
MNAQSLARLQPLFPAMSHRCLQKNACLRSTRLTSHSWQQEQFLR